MKVGDYVRTKDGVIAKITDIIVDFSIDCDRDVFHAFSRHEPDVMEIPWFYKDEYILKSSPNIIDLIEENDLLKIEYFSLRYNERVTRLFEVTFKEGKYINLSNAKCEFMLIDYDFNDKDKKFNPLIKSIVTKEQFEREEYKVGE